MFDEIKPEKICKWYYYLFNVHVKHKTKFPQKKMKIRSHCKSYRALCKERMIKIDRIVSRGIILND